MKNISSKNKINKYKVSVITPFHNVDIEMFKKAFESIKKQSIGFKNIEWIIVMHNCDETYINDVLKLVKNYKNILVKILNNDKHTASSPRNYGLKMATAPYIGFLDGDDSYTIDCLKIALKEIIDTKSQIALFRMEYELNDENAIPIKDLTLWNQSEERIIIERNNWDTEKMFSGMFGWITSRLFERKFLVDNNIKFDEDLILFEDFYMLINALVKAKRVVYLPQLVGYHYLINEKSTLQSKKSGSVLEQYAKGLEILYKIFEEYNIPKYFIEKSAFIFSEMILYSDNVSAIQRQRIKDYIGRFVENFVEYSPNKLLTEEEAHIYYKFPIKVILDTSCELQDLYIRSVIDGVVFLSAVLRKNANTDYGKKYNFSEIKTIEKYFDTLPIISHEKFQKMIYLQIGIGEFNIFTNEKPEYYFINQAGEYIPCVKEHFESYLKAFSLTLTGKKNLLLSIKKNNLTRSNDDALVGDMESILLVEYFTKKYFTEVKRKTRFSSSTGKYFDEYINDDEGYYVLIKDALLDKELEQIVAISTKNVLKGFEVLENNVERLLKDIEKVNIERAKELKEIFSNGFDSPIALKIWPKMEKVIAFGEGENYESKNALKRYIGDIKHNNGYYYTEEAILGKSCGDDSNLFEKSLLSEEFYELVSIKDGKVSLFSQAKIDEPYQLIITNDCGLYRYETNHFIRIKSKDYAKIYFTIY